MEYFVTCPVGLERVLEQELVQILGSKVRRVTGGAGFHGGAEALYRVMIWSRVANRILIVLSRFTLDKQEDLYEQVHAIHWEAQFPVSATFAVKCTGHSPLISNTHFAALRVKDAIVDRFRQQENQRPDVEKQAPDVRVTAHFGRKSCAIYLDFCGAGLHRRGYRQSSTEAPLRENVAAALLLMCGWPDIAAAGGRFYDPFCGSGTLLIEAALMALHKAPGLCRSEFKVQLWQNHEESVWQKVWQEAELSSAEHGATAVNAIVGSDKDSRVLQAARSNVQRAGLEQNINIIKADVSHGAVAELDKTAPGLLLTNPPYGQRMGEKQDLHKLYYNLGRIISDLPAWHIGILLEDEKLLRAMQIEPGETAAVRNGPIDCTLAQYQVAGDQQVLPSMEQLEHGVSENTEAFANRIRKNKRHLDKWAKREGISCYRLYDRDLPEFAFAVDIYKGEQTWLHVQEYEAPAGVDPVKAQLRLQAVVNNLPDILVLPAEQIAIKTRKRQKNKGQYERQDKQRDTFSVSEGGARFWVNLFDYLDTGLFLDSRIIRANINAMVSGKRFLNLFCYTATATVQAVLGGASASCSIDMSKTYLDWASRNFKLNKIASDQHGLLHADCLTWLAQQAERPQGQRDTFDVILLDPPTLSRSKRMEDTLDVQRDHVGMIKNAMALLAEDGVLLFVTNFRKFKLDEKSLFRFSIKNISGKTLPQDFARNKKIHQCWEIRH